MNIRGICGARAGLAYATTTVVYPAEFNCPPGDVTCLIEAITTANANGEADTITLATGTYSLTQVDNDTQGANGLPSITSTITIKGADPGGATIRRDGTAAPFRIFYVAGSATLKLERLTVSGGRAGADAVDRITWRPYSGGCILNAGTAQIIACTTSENSADVNGGGIYNFGGFLAVVGSTVSANAASTDAWRCAGGGGINNARTRGHSLSVFPNFVHRRGPCGAEQTLPCRGLRRRLRSLDQRSASRHLARDAVQHPRMEH